MRALVFAPLIVLFCAVGLTAYFFSPHSGLLAPPISDADAKALYGPNTPKGQKLIERANEILTAIQGTCAELHLKYVGPTQLSPALVRFSSYSYRREGGVRTVVRFTTDDVEIEILANNRSLVRYFNKAVESCIENGPYFEPPDQPKLSKQEAIAVVTRFLNLTPPNGDVRLESPSAKFDHDGYMPTKTGEKTTQGWWQVQWNRFDEEGHPFAGDYAFAWFAEGYGPWAYSSHLDTPYHKDFAPIISQDDAERVAHGALAGAWWDWHHFAAIHLEKSELCICRPRKDVYDSDIGAEGRLAWSQRFGCELPRGNGWMTYYMVTDAHSAEIMREDLLASIGEREK